MAPSRLIFAHLLYLCVLVTALSSCSTPNATVVANAAREGSVALNFEDLAADIDQGHLASYEDKRLRVRGYVRSYLNLPHSGDVIAFGEQLPSSRFPTILCAVSASDTKAGEFRGEEVTAGIYHSAFPDRLVTVNMLFAGRISGQDVYGGRDCSIE